MIEIQYPHSEANPGINSHVAACARIRGKDDDGGALVSSGVFVRPQAVQAIRIRERRPASHHPSSCERESYLELTFEQGATVCVPLYCLDRGKRHEHALKAAKFVEAQIEAAGYERRADPDRHFQTEPDPNS